MGHYEDILWEVHTNIEKYGLQKEFDKELEIISNDEKFKYSTVHERYEFASNKVISHHKKTYLTIDKLNEN